MKIYKIYKLVCLITNKSYIGQTHKNILKRINQHIGRNSLIGNVLRKYEPKNFKIEILWVTTNKETADYIEIAAIDFYNTKAPNGYNLTKGGDGGDTRSEQYDIEKRKRWKWSKESREKFREKKNVKGIKRLDVSKRMKENNPCSHSTQSEMKRLKTRLIKLEKGELKCVRD